MECYWLWLSIWCSEIFIAVSPRKSYYTTNIQDDSFTWLIVNYSCCDERINITLPWPVSLEIMEFCLKSLLHPVPSYQSPFQSCAICPFIWAKSCFPTGPNVLYLIGELPWQSVIAHTKKKIIILEGPCYLANGFCFEACMMFCVKKAILNKWTY